jgi:hypothetical protein
MDDLVLLLFCPEQGDTGVRFEGQWLAHISTKIVLRPTHWLHGVTADVRCRP